MKKKVVLLVTWICNVSQSHGQKRISVLLERLFKSCSDLLFGKDQWYWLVQRRASLFLRQVNQIDNNEKDQNKQSVQIQDLCVSSGESHRDLWITSVHGNSAKSWVS